MGENVIYLPIHYYKNGQLQLALPVTDFPFDLAAPHRPRYQHSAFSRFDSEYHEGISISSEYQERLTDFYQFMPICSFHQFCQFLSLFYQELFDDVIDIQAYLNLSTGTKDTSIASLHTSQSYEVKETESFHNTYHYEQLYLDYIRNGNVDGLKKFFSNAFSLQTGQSEFIMRCKLEEAKALLAYTDKSLSEISSYLCFSSQAYFQNVFKKKYGITPNAYRRQPSSR